MRQQVCVKDGKRLEALRPVWVFEMFNDNQDIYKIWRADLLQCPTCKTQIIGGFAETPYLEHYEDGFAEAVKHILAKEPADVLYWKE